MPGRSIVLTNFGMLMIIGKIINMSKMVCVLNNDPQSNRPGEIDSDQSLRPNDISNFEVYLMPKPSL